MKRILIIAALAGLCLATTGCSNGFLRGGLINGCNDGCNTSSGGLFSGNMLPSGDFFKDGPVRQWLRGDACDTCSIPAGQITYDSGFDSSCDTCGQVGSPVVSGPFTSNSVSGPIVSQPAVNYYPSYDEGAISTGGLNSVNESQFFGDGLDSIELPPLNGN